MNKALRIGSRRIRKLHRRSKPCGAYIETPCKFAACRAKMCVSRKFYSLSKRKDCEKSYPSIVFRSSSGVVVGAML